MLRWQVGLDTLDTPKLGVGQTCAVQATESHLLTPKVRSCLFGAQHRLQLAMTLKLRVSMYPACARV